MVYISNGRAVGKLILYVKSEEEKRVLEEKQLELPEDIYLDVYMETRKEK